MLSSTYYTFCGIISYMKNNPTINYASLRKINPEAARTAVLEYLSSSRNITATARAFGIQRLTVYDILKKGQTANLKDRSKAPNRVANKTKPDIEQKIRVSAFKTSLKGKSLQKFLYERYKLKIAYGTLRGILRRSV